MMIETIRALEKLDYARYEVLIIDNNTKDDAVWQPVEAYVASLGRPNFKFFHLPTVAGLQGRRAQLRADPDRSGCRDRRHHRQRLQGAAGVAEGPRALFRRPRGRPDAGAAGLPRRARGSLQAHVLLGIRRLLPPRHEDARREERDHPARHHGADPQVVADRRRRLGRVVHHRGCRAWPAAVREGLSRGLYREELRQGADARQLRGLSQAALPLGLWRHDHHEGPLARPAAVRPQQAAQSGAALPVPGRLDAVDRRRAAVAVRLSGDRLERRHDVDAGQGRAAADALSHRHARHVLLQGRQVDVALCQQGAVQLPRQSRRRLGRPVAVLRGQQGGVARPLHLQPAVPSHARSWSTSRRSSAASFRRGRRRRSS